jgi:Putative adhesin
MAEHCNNCGAELFVGQRFCRACGTPTDELSQEEAPTQIMPPLLEGRDSRSGASTAPSKAPNTSPVYPPATIGYQPGVPPAHPQTVPPYVPPRSRSPIGWILGFIGVGLFVVVVVAVMFMARAARREIGRMSAPPPPVTPLPGETALDEGSADQVVNSGNETVLSKTFTLGGNPTFTLKSISGSIVISSWDQPKAEVRVTRRGSDRAAPIFYSNTGVNLSVRTAPGRNQDVKYELKLPRHMGRVELSSVNGSIKLSDLSGEIVIEAGNGSIELTDISGRSRVRAGNGKIVGVLGGPANGPMEFEAGNGKIDITVKSDLQADLEASTLRGGIDIDDRLGIPVEKSLVGQHARGQIGSGGPPLRISAANGTIKLSKQ